MKKVTAHCLIKNEENWIWYALNSVIDYVDKIIVYDTGSTDNTVKIIKSIKNPKIIFEERGEVDKKQFTDLRQEMLDRTKTDWLIVLDGDEVWPNKSIEVLIKAIDKAPESKDAVIVGLWLCEGDVFHYNEYWAENRNMKHSPKRLMGYMQPRAIRKIQGLHCIGPYGEESYADKKGVNISYWDNKRLIFLEEKYFHMSFLPRSASVKKDKDVMMRGLKRRFYKGKPFPKNMKYPDVFYLKRPSMVPNPWIRLTRVGELKGVYFRTKNVIERLRK